jgi:hypothetical protein
LELKDGKSSPKLQWSHGNLGLLVGEDLNNSISVRNTMIIYDNTIAAMEVGTTFSDKS